MRDRDNDADPDLGSDPDRPGPLEDDPVPGQPGGVTLIGPLLGVMIGYVVFQLLPDDFHILVALGIALVAIALTTYVTLEVTRRRARRG